jgi:hypothetical protein
MRRIAMIVILTLGFAVVARADYQGPLTVSIYSRYATLNGDGEPYSGLVGIFLSPDIMFGRDTFWHWRPFGLHTFAADIAGIFNAPATGSYRFNLLSDDGSQLFMDGSLTVDDGGAHPPTYASGVIFLTAGDHLLDVKFFECCTGRSGVNLYLPSGPSSVPEPSTLLLLLTGGLAVRLMSLRSKLLRTTSI